MCKPPFLGILGWLASPQVRGGGKGILSEQTNMNETHGCLSGGGGGGALGTEVGELD